MGVTITANHSSYEFSMGYGGFFNLRKNIALALDKEFGENYANLVLCFFKKDFEENDAIANIIIKRKHLDDDIIDFLYMPDTDGTIPYRTCGKIYEIIKDIDFEDKRFQYAAYSDNDYNEFKMFLKECFSHRRSMRWW